MISIVFVLFYFSVYMLCCLFVVVLFICLQKKSRGWPKGRKRKMTPEVTGPRAPMTG